MPRIFFVLCLLICLVNYVTCRNSLADSLNNLNRLSKNYHRHQVNSSTWVVLVAGSNDYVNYRHQADVCHAYQLVRRHGTPEENIITMMFDDIANNTENPTPGVIVNHPDGPNVYDGVKIDYRGREVTPENLLKVLEGDRELQSMGKRVVQSSSTDYIFVYFSDHGAPGLIAFPSSELLASDLMRTLDRMYHNNRYAKMLIYVEACESGSMFEHLLKPDRNIFAVTAANSSESSWACYWDDEREAYLGDVFSVKWMEDADMHGNLRVETIQEEYRRVQDQTNGSHVMEWGDETMSHMSLSEFMGRRVPQSNFPNEFKLPIITDAIMSHDVPMMTALRRAKKAKNPIEREARMSFYNHLVEGRSYMEDSVKRLAAELREHLREVESDLMSETKLLTHFSCYEELYRTFDEHCFDLSTHPYALKFLYVLVNTCQHLERRGSNSSSHMMAKDVIMEHCTRHVKTHPFKQIV